MSDESEEKSAEEKFNFGKFAKRLEKKRRESIYASKNRMLHSSEVCQNEAHYQNGVAMGLDMALHILDEMLGIEDND